MKFQNLKNWKVATGAALVGALLALPVAKAELVYDDAVKTADATPRVEDREATRQVVTTSEKAKTTTTVEAAAAQPAAIAAPATAAPAAAPATLTTQVVAPVQPVVLPAVQAVQPTASTSVEVQNMSKAELLRRERMREELKNEDLLQERLEQLRLRDEQKRTDQVLGAPAPSGAAVAGAVGPTGAVTTLTVQDQAVVAPITERPGQPAPTVVAPAATRADSLTVSSASATSTTTVNPADLEDDRAVVSISPRAGTSSMKGDSFNDVRSRYSVGVGLTFEVSDNLAFETGYTYTEFGITPASATSGFGATVMSPYGGYGTFGGYPYGGYAAYPTAYSGYNTGFGASSAETRVMKQNVIDAGIRLSFLGRDSKFRPFVGGGAGYSKSFLNYDGAIIDNMRLGPTGVLATQDYESSAFLGYLSTGFDIRMSKKISVGAMFKYYSVLTSRQNNNTTFLPGAYNGGYAAYNAAAAADPEKYYLGSSLANSSFYSILGTISFNL